MYRKISLLLIIIVSLISTTACSTSNSNVTESEGLLNVSVSFNAMKELVKVIGKEKVSISTIVPDGIEPHDFEPKAQDLINLNNSSIFVYNGLGIELWAEEAIEASDNTELIVVNASQNANLITNTSVDAIDEHGQYDPHVWLSLTGAKSQALAIKEALIKADTANEAFYEQNYEDFAAQLDTLQDTYKTKFDSLDKKSFVSGHAAFAYLCREFGLEQNSVEDVFAEGQPSAQQLAELVNYCKENNVTTIFAEELASPEVSKTLANEVGAKVDTIYTIESSEDNKTYLERMSDNLEKIYESLQ